MKLINLLRPQHFATPEGEKKIIQAMLANAYRQGLIAGETGAYNKVINLLHAQEIKFLSILDRRGAVRPDPSEHVRAMLALVGSAQRPDNSG